jgi:aspartate/methionine/tyrosine aminotransferase
MNPLAEELNRIIRDNNPNVYDMLGSLGKEMFFPKGILTQSAEAKEKAHKYNATIGIATEKGGPMHLPCIHKFFNGLQPSDIYTYAPPAGRPDLRKAWLKKLQDENPRLRGKDVSTPVVVSAITHGLSVVGDLFIEPGDVVLIHDKYWGNYRLTFSVMRKAKIETYPTYTDQGGFNVKAMEEAILKHGAAKGKVVVLLNFPINPTGYSPTIKEAEAVAKALASSAASGINLVVIHDDAYFGLFFENEVMKESLFGLTANLHEKILALKLCGATKEEYVWGFRTGFLTFGAKAKVPAALYAALEKKAMGVIRGNISNSPHPSQTIVLKALESPGFGKERQEKFEIMKIRANKVKEVLANNKYDSAWAYYPFNSGYFMCLNLKIVDAEKLRIHLLDKYGVGTISTGEKDLRVAFSCIETENIQELFDIIYGGVCDLMPNEDGYSQEVFQRT